jgi:hypothetical protein
MKSATKRMKSVEVESKKPAEMVARTAEEIPKYAFESPATCPVTSVGKMPMESAVAVMVVQEIPICARK